MARVELSPHLIEIDAVVRIERGPARRKAVATPELLADTMTHPMYFEGGVDSAGKIIVLGQEMEYLDFLGEHGWYVYKLLPAPDAAEIDITTWPDVFHGVPYRWLTAGYSDTAEDAEALAAILL